MCLLRGMERTFIYNSDWSQYLHTHAIAQALSCLPVTAEARIEFQISPREFVVHKVTLVKIFLPVLLFSPVSIMPPIFHTHLHLSTRSYKDGMRTSSGNLTENNSPSERGSSEHKNALTFRAVLHCRWKRRLLLSSSPVSLSACQPLPPSPLHKTVI